MSDNRIELDTNLRYVIRTSRHHARLTQREAAAKAGISEIWWAQLESGIKAVTTTDRLVDMLAVTKTPPRALRKAGHSEIAHQLELRYDWFGADAFDLAD